MTTPTGNGWDQWQKVVLYRLDDINEHLDRMDRRIANLEIRVTQMRVKVGLGAAIVASLVAGVITWIANGGIS